MKIFTFIFCLFLSVNALAQNTAHGNPLYVIDGVIVTNETRDYLNPANIQSISILKGKAAIALYGEKGANGVVIITTKSHKVKKPLNRFTLLQHAYISTPDSLKPLIAIDGAIYKGSIMAIDTNTIVGIDFVKPEWATIIYGNAGAHGVITFKTKSPAIIDTLKKQ